MPTTQHNTTPQTRATLGAEMAWMEKQSYVAVKLDAELSAVLLAPKASEASMGAFYF